MTLLSSHPDAPPNEPWKPLVLEAPATGYASFYHADELAGLPVRAITKIKDNKSDPNVETGTYGLFSTCQQTMRSGIVKRSPEFVFFVTRPRGGPRHLTGYYRLGWYAPGSFGGRDYALAASAIRFIDPVPLFALPRGLDVALGGRWRLSKRLDSHETADLVAVVDERPDRTPDYLQEIDRMERANAFHSGFRYPTWRRTESWSWAAAGRYLRPPGDANAGIQSNQSPTDWWQCSLCRAAFENKALLKACPTCHELGTLRGVSPAELVEIESSS